MPALERRAVRLHSPRIRDRRPLSVALAALVLGGGLVGGVIATDGLAQPTSEEKEEVDEKLRRAEERLDRARGREEVLTDQVIEFTDDIRDLEERLAPLRARADAAEAKAARLRERLEQLTTRLEIEKRRLARAEDVLVTRRRLLAERLRDVYVRGEPDPILVLIQSESVSSAIDSVTALERVVDSDRNLVGSVQEYRDESERTKQTIASVRAETDVAEARAEEAAQEARAATADLERKRAAKDQLLDGRRDLLAEARGDRENIAAEARDLERRSAALGAKIVAAQQAAAARAAAPATPSGAPAPAAGGAPPPPAAPAIPSPPETTLPCVIS